MYTLGHLKVYVLSHLRSPFQVAFLENQHLYLIVSFNTVPTQNHNTENEDTSGFQQDVIKKLVRFPCKLSSGFSGGHWIHNPASSSIFCKSFKRASRVLLHYVRKS